MLATQFHGEWGDAYVAFESVMRVHAGDGGWRRDWRRSGLVNETETFKGDEENGGRGEGDKRNVESKKQKERRNKSVARELGRDDRDGKKRDTADQCEEGIGEKRGRGLYKNIKMMGE